MEIFFLKGFLDTNGLNIVQKEAQKTKQLVESGLWLDAYEAWISTRVAIYRQSPTIDFFNVLKKNVLYREHFFRVQGKHVGIFYN